MLSWADVRAAAPVIGFDDLHARKLAAQPPGLTMELRLPKTRFSQGELIPATLVFRNDTGQPYFASTRTTSRRGRVDEFSFRAATEDGTLLRDPLERYFLCGSDMSGGGMSSQDIGETQVTMAVNQWLRFDHPGVYRLYACSNGVRTGHHADNRKPNVAVDTVSQIVSVQIDPMAPGEEQEILAQAKTDLDSNQDDVRRGAVARLRALQTAAAREMLLPLVGRPDLHEATLGLAEAPNPAAEAPRILQDVATHRLPLKFNLLIEYPRLKLAAEPTGAGRPWFTAGDTDRRTLLDAARASLAASKWDAVSGETLLALIEHDARFKDDPKDPQLHSLLVAHQLDLSAEIADEVLEKLGRDDEQEFLPLARRDAQPPRCSAVALEVLARVAPEEARPVIVEDVEHALHRHSPHFGDPPWGRSPRSDMAAVLSLPENTRLPELDGVLRARLSGLMSALESTYGDSTETMLLVDHYASAALLPDVLRFYLPAEGHQVCELESTVLRYWLRCDPAAGAVGLHRALSARKDRGCYKSLLTGVLGSVWNEAALPVVLDALDDEDAEVWASAVQVLAVHAATPATAERIVASADRLAARPLPENESASTLSVARQNAGVERLLDNKDWTLTREQLTRLQGLPRLRPEVRQRIDKRLDQIAD